MLYVADRARNVQLISSRPELPQQTYQHGTRTSAGRNKTASIDYCNTQPAQQRGTAAGGRQSAGSCVSSASFIIPSSTVCSQASSKNSLSSSERRQPSEHWRVDRSTALYEHSASNGSQSVYKADWQRPLNTTMSSYHNTTLSSSSSLSLNASSANQQLSLRNGLLQLHCIVLK